MNAMSDVAEARATALSLRASAEACTAEQGALKFRLTRAAESLDAMVLLAVRGFDRIEQLEQQLAAKTAGSSTIPADTPIAPVIVAVRILRMVTDEMDESANELRVSVQAARKIVWEVFTDLEAASVRSAP